jgi:hypothetical protein
VLFVAPEAQVGLVVVRMEGVHVLFFLKVTINQGSYVLSVVPKPGGGGNSCLRRKFVLVRGS